MVVNYFNFMFSYIEKLIATEIPEEEKRKVMEIFKPMKLHKKQFFLKEGDISSVIAFNVSGLILEKESEYYIESLEDCMLMVADYTAFIKLTENNLFWINAIKKLHEQILIYKEGRESSFLTCLRYGN